MNFIRDNDGHWHNLALVKHAEFHRDGKGRFAPLLPNVLLKMHDGTQCEVPSGMFEDRMAKAQSQIVPAQPGTYRLCAWIPREKTEPIEYTREPIIAWRILQGEPSFRIDRTGCTYLDDPQAITASGGSDPFAAINLLPDGSVAGSAQRFDNEDAWRVWVQEAYERIIERATRAELAEHEAQARTDRVLDLVKLDRDLKPKADA